MALLLVLLLVLVVAVGLVVLPLLGLGDDRRSDIQPRSGESFAPDLGALGRELTAVGYSCVLELSAPVIGGCRARKGDELQTVRWQGPGDQPIALFALVSPAELEPVVTALARSGSWTEADAAAVLAQAPLPDQGAVGVDTSWGPVQLRAYPSFLFLDGTGTGETVEYFAGKRFSTSEVELRSRATTLGYRCEPDSSDRALCRDDPGNTLTMESSGGLVTALGGTFGSEAGPGHLAALVEAASPADAAALRPLVLEGAAAPSDFYGAAGGYLVTCSRRDVDKCSVFGVSWP